jgi:hypothetical protein
MRYCLESPRLSSFLVFLLSGLVCYGVSCITKWFPGADGRFTTHRRQGSLLDGTHDARKGQNTHLPGRPRRLSLPILVLCIVLRLEIFHRVNYQQQCATPGLEVRLCPLSQMDRREAYNRSVFSTTSLLRL